MMLVFRVCTAKSLMIITKVFFKVFKLKLLSSFNFMSFIARKTLRNFLFQNFLNLMLRKYELLKSLAILCQNIAADSESLAPS